MRTWNRTAVLVVPKQPLLDWLQAEDPDSADMTLPDLERDPSIYLLPEVDSDDEAAHFLAGYCGDIFEEQLAGWLTEPECWPKDRGFDNFKRWFQYSFHSMVIDLSDAPLVSIDMSVPFDLR